MNDTAQTKQSTPTQNKADNSFHPMRLIGSFVKKYTGPLLGTFAIALATLLVVGEVTLRVTDGFGRWKPTLQEIADDKLTTYEGLRQMTELKRDTASGNKNGWVLTASVAMTQELATIDTWLSNERKRIDDNIADAKKIVPNAENNVKKARAALEQAMNAENSAPNSAQALRELDRTSKQIIQAIATSSATLDTLETQLTAIRADAEKWAAGRDAAVMVHKRAQHDADVLRTAMRSAELSRDQLSVQETKARHAFQDLNGDIATYLALAKARTATMLEAAKFEAAKMRYTGAAETEAQAKLRHDAAIKAVDEINASHATMKEQIAEVTTRREAAKTEQRKLAAERKSLHETQREARAKIVSAQQALQKAGAAVDRAKTRQAEKVAAPERDLAQLETMARQRQTTAQTTFLRQRATAEEEYRLTILKIEQDVAKVKEEAELAQARARGENTKNTVTSTSSAR